MTNKEVIDYVLYTPNNTNPSILRQKLEEQDFENRPDWNQNDPTAPDYVKNRTHYSETVEEMVIEEAPSEFEDIFGNGSVYFAEFDSGVDFVDGGNYNVTFNSERYSFVYNSDSGYIGNLSLDDAGEDTGEPFLTDGWCVWTKANEPCTIRITHMVEQVTVIPKKYLPPEEYDMVVVAEWDNGADLSNFRNYVVAIGTSPEVIGKIRNHKQTKVALILSRDAGSEIITVTHTPFSVSAVGIGTLRLSFFVKYNETTAHGAQILTLLVRGSAIENISLGDVM